MFGPFHIQFELLRNHNAINYERNLVAVDHLFVHELSLLSLSHFLNLYHKILFILWALSTHFDHEEKASEYEGN